MSAARARQLRSAVAARRGLPRTAHREGTTAFDAAGAGPPAEGARRPDAPADPRAPGEATAEHARACAARRPDRRGDVEAAACPRIRRPAEREARGLLRRVLAGAGEARDALARARPPRRRLANLASLRIHVDDHVR